MGERIRTFDWSGTPLGPIEVWPPSLRVAVDLVLGSCFPMILLWGPDLIQIYNDAYGVIAGAKHPAALGQPRRASWPEAWQVNAPIYERVFRGESVSLTDHPFVLAPDGTTAKEAYFTVCYSPIHNEAEAVGGVLLTVFDTTERLETERKLRASEERLRLAIETARLAEWVWEIETGNQDWSPRLLSILGLPSDHPVNAEMFIARIHHEDRDRVERAITAALAGRARYQLEFRMIGADGRLSWISSNGNVVAQPGKPTRMVGVALDVTERKRAEEHQKLLLAELQHRVRNTLAVVRSIIRRTAATSRTAEDFALHLDGRISALGRTESLVARDPHRGVDLEFLVAEELMAHGAREDDQVSINGPEVRLQPRVAETFGLAVHELATNALKFGALAVPEGRIAVTWRVEEAEGDPHLVFEWVETNVRVVAPAPRREGFGTELLESTIAYELAATASLSFGPGGLRYAMKVPLTERVAVRGGRPRGLVA
jgi:PAS domain S-box-containing protein